MTAANNSSCSLKTCLRALFQLISIKLSILLSSGPREPKNNIFFILPTLYSHFACRRLQSIPPQNLLEASKQSCAQKKVSSFHFTSLDAAQLVICSTVVDMPVSPQDPAVLVLTPLCSTAPFQTFTFCTLPHVVLVRCSQGSLLLYCEFIP